MMHPVDGRAEQPCARARQKKIHNQQASKPPSAEQVVATFNTWAFKREQPSDVSRMIELVRSQMALHKPIEFVLYWGKGPRNEIDAPETECLDYLAEMAGRIKGYYTRGANIRLICTDTHALLNGHSRSSIRSYFGSVGEAAARRGFRWCLLGDLTQAQSGNLTHVCPADRPQQTIRQLERSAARWYKGSGNPIEGAIAYFDMNMVEKCAVELEFPDAIFITFSGSELRELFPERLPVFYMYSVRKGVSVKPWFIAEDPVINAASG